MRIIHLSIDSTTLYGSVLDGFRLTLDRGRSTGEMLSTVCLIGANGAGKSQLLQRIAEIFQDAWHTCSPEQERADPNNGLNFEIVYEVERAPGSRQVVRLHRSAAQTNRSDVRLELEDGGRWQEVESNDPRFGELLPPVIVGYTSGDNETLSLPFFRSRAAYARDVATTALNASRRLQTVPDSRLLLVDYATNLEVLIANLMLGSHVAAEELLSHADLADLSSWRCVIQLQPSTVGRGGVKLTAELEQIIADLRSASTCQHYDRSTGTYTLDFLVDDQSRKAFAAHWGSAVDLYRAFHKLAMLNDLAIPKKARARVNREIEIGRFAARLPEPQDEQKVFRFEEVRFRPKDPKGTPIDYVALSDGEHQQAQILGILSMITDSNALFLFDEPESHFNPQWRVKFVSRIQDLSSASSASRELVLSSHAPFVPSDMPRERVVVLERNGSKVTARNPRTETFGASFDQILRDCFEINPPISQVAREEIERLMASNDVNEMEQAISGIGSSVKRAFLLDRINQLKLRDADLAV